MDDEKHEKPTKEMLNSPKDVRDGGKTMQNIFSRQAIFCYFSQQSCHLVKNAEFKFPLAFNLPVKGKSLTDSLVCRSFGGKTS